MKKKNILVTGVGAIIGYGIIKSLKSSKYEVNITGIDIYDDAVGRFWCDQFVQGVKASSVSFRSFVEEIVNKHNIDLIIPGIEQDIDALSTFHPQLKCKVALNSKNALDVFNNKKRTYQLAQTLPFKHIPFLLSEEVNEDDVIRELGFPCVVKPEVSYAGKGLHFLSSKSDLLTYCGKQGYLLQKMIHSHIEYTVSVFGLGDGTYSNPIAFKRTLGPDGATHKAEIFSNSPFIAQMTEMCNRVKPVGPTNFQFIQDSSSNNPLLLEVNPRISSSSSLRTAFGINEPEMCIEYYLEDTIPKERTIKKGKAFRFIDEIIEYDSNNS